MARRTEADRRRTEAIRKWGIQMGYLLAERGRLPAQVIREYEATESGERGDETPDRLSESVMGRLYNWKFDTALRYARADGSANEQQLETIGVLARMFGNCGYIDGDISELIRCTVCTLDPRFTDEHSEYS